MADEWRTIPSFPLYEASDSGQIRRRIAYPSRRGPGRILKGTFDQHGYLYVSPGSGTHIGIHVLVCEAFQGKKPGTLYEVGHRDGTRTNNVPANLRWVTAKEQAADRMLHGTTNRGEKCTFSKLIAEQAIAIRNAVGVSQRQLARQFGISQPAVGYIRRGEVWKHV